MGVTLPGFSVVTLSAPEHDVRIHRALIGSNPLDADPAAVHAGERTSIIAWPIARDGRKLHSASALYAEDGRLCAYAKTLWITL